MTHPSATPQPWEEKRIRVLQKIANAFREAPCMMCVLRGPDHLIELANDLFCERVGQRNPAGRTLLDVWPELP